LWVEDVPDKVAEPADPPVNVTPLGSLPDSESVGVGVPVAVTLKLNATPCGVVRLLALVIAGATGAVVTVRVAGCVVAGFPTPLVNTASY